MKRMISCCVTPLFLTPVVFANGPSVTLSGPTPSIASAYVAGSSSTVVYTITNHVPKQLPLTVSGISGVLTRTTVANDCGTHLSAASITSPSTCNIGITIAPTTAQISSSINQTLTVNYQGRIPLTSPISLSVTQPHFIFITSTTHDGNLGGVSGADALCQTAAYQTGSILSPGLTFKALLVTDTRYPCSSTDGGASGSCGGSYANDWPLVSGSVYKNPNGTTFNTVNSNGVFDGFNPVLFDETDASSAGNNFWNGTQSILSNANSTDIVGWAFTDMNSAADGTQYGQNFAACTLNLNPPSDAFTTNRNDVNGSYGTTDQTIFAYGPPPSSTWGNYLYFDDNNIDYLTNLFTSPNVQTCDTALHLVCVS